MLQRHNRLRRKNDFLRVYRYGKRRRSSMAMLIVRSNGLSESRFAVSAGRRIGNAVTRNLARRRVREAVRLHLPEIDQGWDCLFVLYPAAAAASYAEIERTVLRLLSRARLIIEPAAREMKAL